MDPKEWEALIASLSAENKKRKAGKPRMGVDVGQAKMLPNMDVDVGEGEMLPQEYSADIGTATDIEPQKYEVGIGKATDIAPMEEYKVDIGQARDITDPNNPSWKEILRNFLPRRPR